MRTACLFPAAVALLALLALLAACAMPDTPWPPFTPWTTIYGAMRDERSVPEMLVDKAIATDIKAILMHRDERLGLRVKIYCFLRRVTLLGRLDDDEDFKALALATAWEEPGVRGVSTVWLTPRPGDTRLDDLRIAADLRAALVADEDISATQIEAEVFGGEVYLMGMVRGQADVDRAVAVAREVRGVSFVVSLLIPTWPDGPEEDRR